MMKRSPRAGQTIFWPHPLHGREPLRRGWRRRTQQMLGRLPYLPPAKNWTPIIGTRLPVRRGRACIPKSLLSRNGWLMSALLPKADIEQHDWYVRFVPKADIRDSSARIHEWAGNERRRDHPSGALRSDWACREVLCPP